MIQRAWLLLPLLLTACEAPAAAPQPADPDAPLRSWIAAERERLTTTAVEMGEGGEEIAAELAAVAAEAEAGRTLHAASRVAAPRLRVEARAYGSSRRADVPDLVALEEEAARVAAELARLEAAMEADLGERPAAIRALADGAWVRGRAYHGAAVAYARVTSIEAGLFYLGSARSLLATAADLAALPLARPEGGDRSPSPAELDGELAVLDRRIVAAYRVPGAEVDRHSEFIALNAEIKAARDLLAAGRPDGALLATLESRRRLEEILDAGAAPGQAPEPGPDAGAAGLRERAASFRARCDSAAWDASLGRLLVESAEAALGEAAPGPEPLRRARAVLLHVLPRYFELHEETP